MVSVPCFSCRGPELFSALRAMELENAGSRTFDWLPFFIHLDPANAKSAAFDAGAPAATMLVQKDGVLLHVLYLNHIRMRSSLFFLNFACLFVGFVAC